MPLQGQRVDRFPLGQGKVTAEGQGLFSQHHCDVFLGKSLLLEVSWVNSWQMLVSFLRI